MELINHAYHEEASIKMPLVWGSERSKVVHTSTREGDAPQLRRGRISYTWDHPRPRRM